VNTVREFKLNLSIRENQAERSATALKISVPIKKGTRTLRLVVRDSSGRIGSAELILPAQP